MIHRNIALIAVDSSDTGARLSVMDDTHDGMNGETLTVEQQRRLTMIGELRRHEAHWQAERLKVFGSAAQLVDDGHLALEEACAALEISVSTWYRRRAEFRAHMAGRGSAAATAEADQAARGAADLLGDGGESDG